MSTTDLCEFINGVYAESHGFKNSWGGAARIWDSLFEAYIEKRSDYDNWMSAAQDGRLWEVWRDERLSEAERLVYWFCCDNALVKAENFAAMATALRGFASRHPTVGRIDHLPAFAEVFEKSKADAIGLYATSVGDHPWYGRNEETDEGVPYDLSSGDKHWFVFDRLKDFAAT